MNTTKTRTHRLVPALALTAALAALTALPAAATPDPGPLRRYVDVYRSLPLQRVGTEFVRGDDLTGNGVPAPHWVTTR